MPPKKKERKKAVQISVATNDLKSIDADEEAKRLGRSAFIIGVVLRYMRAKKEREMADQIGKAYEGHEQEIFDEMVAPFLASQVWPGRRRTREDARGLPGVELSFRPSGWRPSRWSSG